MKYIIGFMVIMNINFIALVVVGNNAHLKQIQDKLCLIGNKTGSFACVDNK